MKKNRMITEILDEYLKDKEFALAFLSLALQEELPTLYLSLKDLIRAQGNFRVNVENKTL